MFIIYYRLEGQEYSLEVKFPREVHAIFELIRSSTGKLLRVECFDRETPIAYDTMNTFYKAYLV